ncbi:hypothetical protein QI155_04320 [Thermodesulfovibrio sp. 1176]|uniref:hypothetical protein n=1 Tax=Thermodesulfovibrio sp. 1176 TaxID=3043424 RepID=UPI0024829668|nr:hypothetical protein [Thermodesulfovibrio sp. 1176]MDI1471752.1 hypothetical protein [Thermodesulfovibrio sp. 1176]
MKENAFTSLICEKFCHYYKPEKETELCGSYFYLQKSITPSELKNLVELLHLDTEIVIKHDLIFICSKCDFREDGCDFIINKSSIPCGGYIIISRLLNYLNL